MRKGDTAKRRKDTDEVVAGVRRQIRSLEKRAAEEDPTVAADMAALADELQAAVDRTVPRLRAAGFTWQSIGYEFGLTRQGAFNRWGQKVGPAGGDQRGR